MLNLNGFMHILNVCCLFLNTLLNTQNNNNPEICISCMYIQIFCKISIMIPHSFTVKGLHILGTSRISFDWRTQLVLGHSCYITMARAQNMCVCISDMCLCREGGVRLIGAFSETKLHFFSTFIKCNNAE